MGQFESTVPYYVRYRLRYPEDLITQVAACVGLDRSSGVLDLGCGPGFLACAFAPHAGRVVGVDPEPEMLEAARAAAQAAGIAAEWVESRAEALDPDLGSFRLAVIGRAFHWMDQDRVLALLDRLIEPGGAVALFADSSPEHLGNSWSPVWHAAIARHLDPHETVPYRPEQDIAERYAATFSASAFPVLQRISRIRQREATVEELVGRALSMSPTSPARLGAARPAFEAALIRALEPFASAGRIREVVEIVALIARRP